MSLREPGAPPTVLTPELLRTSIAGHQLTGGSLDEVFDDRTTLLVFLRHYG